jgi:hypothetical protein
MELAARGVLVNRNRTFCGELPKRVSVDAEVLGSGPSIQPFRYTLGRMGRAFHQAIDDEVCQTP